MNQGLAILMERIDTNPEEFISEGEIGGIARLPKRWAALIGIALDSDRSGTFVTPEERAALTAKLGEVRGDRFHKEVLRKLMQEPSGDDSSDQMLYSNGVAKSMIESMRVQQAMRSAQQAVSQSGLANSQLGNLSSTVQMRRPEPEPWTLSFGP
jgi:hypothetical protein